MESIKDLLKPPDVNSPPITRRHPRAGCNNGDEVLAKFPLRPMTYRTHVYDAIADDRDYYERVGRDGYAPKPNCPKCGGSGFVHPVSGGQVLWKKLIPCDAPECYVESRLAYQSGTMHMARMGVTDIRQTFAAFEQSWLGSQDMYKAFYNLATDVDAPPLLLVYGNTGSGKTHLCNAIAISLIHKGVQARLWSVPDLCSYLKLGMNDNTLEIRMQSLKTLPILIMDDWKDLTDWSESRLEEIVSSRYEHSLATVVTTNLDFMALPERLRSRFSHKEKSVCVLVQSADYRSRKV